MRRFRVDENTPRVGSATRTRSTETPDGTGESVDRDRSLLHCTGASDTGFHVCLVALPPEFHRPAALDRDAHGVAA